MPQSSNLSLYSKPLVSQIEQSLPNMIKKMTQFMGQLTQAVTPRDNSKAGELKSPSKKEIDSFDGTQAHKVRGFIQSCQLIFHNNSEKSFSDRKKVLYSTSSRTGRAGKLIEPYLSNNFKKILHISSIIGCYTGYHERQKETGETQYKKPRVTDYNASRPPEDSYSKRPHHKKNKKGKQFQASKDKSNASLLNKDNKLIGSERERRIKAGLCTYCGGNDPIENTSRDVRTSVGHQEAPIARRERSEWES
ncbi:hypothetical protein O181_073174 [Austropuccinia psidii MF-1]|uniref:Uncharacterized protein n=1 Tax=Austropuccinia psidii MF-1 TaxID=1389203 RepID=A0A9Q3F667_9BASI|nr:hypothetical protein [Austropuccinia psidii MF-1]